MKNGSTVSVTFHDLDEMVLVAQIRPGEMYLCSSINWSDRHHEIAAIILAKKTGLQVIWQDIAGLKHFVNEQTKPGHHLSSLDSRCRESRHLRLVK